MAELDWPVLLLVTRITVVVALYLFVLVAVSALRAEIGVRTMPAPVPTAERSVSVEREAILEQASGAALDEATTEQTEADEPLPDDLEVVRPARRSPWVYLAPLSVGVPLLLVGAMVFVLRSGSTPFDSASPSSTSTKTQPAPAPVPGRVAVSLSAAEDSGVRVTVDGTVQFEGTMRAGERRNWDGKSVVAVWTDKGKSLRIAVDGRDLGPYSPAMGHADWNRIEYSFWPGWSQSQPR